MAQVIWTTRATNELANTATYLEDYSVTYATSFVRKVYDRVGQLATFPEMGRVIPEINRDTYRELLEGNYRIMYELLDDIVLIQQIVHQARNFENS